MARSQEFARLFQQPVSPAQRHYEICRAYFHESASADHIAELFHLRVSSVRAIVRDFARDPDVNAFFAAAEPGRKTSPKRDAINADFRGRATFLFRPQLFSSLSRDSLFFPVL